MKGKRKNWFTGKIEPPTPPANLEVVELVMRGGTMYEVLEVRQDAKTDATKDCRWERVMGGE